MSFLESSLWVYAYIESPLLIWLLYPAIKKMTWLGSPKLVFAAVSVETALFAYQHQQPHIIVAGIMVLAAYSLLVFRWKYPRLESIILAVLAVLAVDQLWQVPLDILHWSTPFNAAIGLATGAFSWMSVPIFFYFVSGAGGRIRVGRTAEAFASVGIILAALSLLFDLDLAYAAVIPWFLFFLQVIRESRPV
jgi:hypothetical protein